MVVARLLAGDAISIKVPTRNDPKLGTFQTSDPPPFAHLLGMLFPCDRNDVVIEAWTSTADKMWEAASIPICRACSDRLSLSPQPHVGEVIMTR